jgi:hypothetical protein
MPYVKVFNLPLVKVTNVSDVMMITKKAPASNKYIFKIHVDRYITTPCITHPWHSNKTRTQLEPAEGLEKQEQNPPMYTNQDTSERHDKQEQNQQERESTYQYGGISAKKLFFVLPVHTSCEPFRILNRKSLQLYLSQSTAWEWNCRKHHSKFGSR